MSVILLTYSWLQFHYLLYTDIKTIKFISYELDMVTSIRLCHEVSNYLFEADDNIESDIPIFETHFLTVEQVYH